MRNITIVGVIASFVFIVVWQYALPEVRQREKYNDISRHVSIASREVDAFATLLEDGDAELSDLFRYADNALNVIDRNIVNVLNIGSINDELSNNAVEYMKSCRVLLRISKDIIGYRVLGMSNAKRVKEITLRINMENNIKNIKTLNDQMIQIINLSHENTSNMAYARERMLEHELKMQSISEDILFDKNALISTTSMQALVALAGNLQSRQN